MADSVGITTTTLRVFSRDQARAVDEEALHHFGIPGIVLMENAARNAAAVALRLIEETDLSRGATIYCGSGNNGGDGYAMARHLHNAGVEVDLIALGEPRERTDARTNFDICRRMGLPVHHFTMHDGPLAEGLIVDAIFGTGLTRPVVGAAAQAIEKINSTGRVVLSIDLPSGLDCDAGTPLGAAVRATATVSFLGWKRGFLNPAAAGYTGRIIVADIGVPRELLTAFSEPLVV